MLFRSSRFLFYSAIYLLDLPPGKERAALLSLRTLRYTWSFWSWCRHRRMSPHGVVSSCLAVSPLPFAGRSVFCYGIHKITPICAFHSRLPFPVRTFLSRKFLTVISSSLHVPHILTTERLLRYSSLAFLEIPRHKFSRATDRSTLFRWFHLLHFYCENVTGGMFSMGTCYTFVVKT